MIEKLAKSIKSQLGTGGTIKGKIIEIQGNHVLKMTTNFNKGRLHHFLNN